METGGSCTTCSASARNWTRIISRSTRRCTGGFFKEKPRHLEPKTRELIEIGLLAFKGMKHEVYTHTKKALRLGATMEEALEAFEVASIGGGAPVLMEGLYALKRIADEQAEEERAKSG